MPALIRKTHFRDPSDELERHTTWLEIFFDLIFAVIVTELAFNLFKNLSYLGVVKSLALFIPVIWTWASYTVFAARFDNDDVIHWFMTFIIMFAGAIMATQISLALDKNANGYAIGFVIAQLGILLLYARVIYDPQIPKSVLELYLIGFGIGAILWIISLFVATPYKFMLWVSGMVVYMITPWIGRKKILAQLPLHPVYIPERFGAFTIIILGQMITAVVFGLESAEWNADSIITGVLAFGLGILIWAQYYRFTQRADYKCTLRSGQPYIYLHIPLILSLIMMGACAEDFIIAPDVVHPHVHSIFCFATILWLVSFYMLQYVAIAHLHVRKYVYILGILLILSLILLVNFSAIVTLALIVATFAIIFYFQCYFR